MKPTETQYRIYADNTVVHEDEFDDVDLSASMSDDYTTITVPDLVVDFIAESFACVPSSGRCCVGNES